MKEIMPHSISRILSILPQTLAGHIDQAEMKAIDSLARYKFQGFGYWAGIWVHLNQIEGKKRPSPFTDLVKLARSIRGNQE